MHLLDVHEHLDCIIVVGKTHEKDEERIMKVKAQLEKEDNYSSNYS